MNFLKTPLSGKLVSDQLLPPPPWKMTPPPSPKTVDLYQDFDVLQGGGHELGSDAHKSLSF